jgi:hypothetical protein
MVEDNRAGARGPAFAHGLGRLESPPDPRDYRMADAVAVLEKELRAPRTWHSDRVLDQHESPHCVGFAWAAWGIATPVEDNWRDPVGHSIYAKCKVLDGEPGAENGSTVRSGAKVMQAAGRIGTYFFASGVDEACDFIARFGPVVFGTVWTEGMFKPSPIRAIVAPGGKVVGGHAWLGIGVDSSRVKIRNSWGSGWGAYGDAWIRIRDLRAIFGNGGEACAATEKPLPIGAAA